MDYLVYQLKLNGIYTNFNLNVGRVYKSGDGVQDYSLIGVAKAVTYFDPRLVELQKEYARQLLTHHNPYTKTSYNDEPAIAIVEIVNENSRPRVLAARLVSRQPRPRGTKVAARPHAISQEAADHAVQHLARQDLSPPRPSPASAPPRMSPPEKTCRSSNARSSTPRPRSASTPKGTSTCTSKPASLRRCVTTSAKTSHVKSLIVGTADHTYFVSGMPLVRTTSRYDIVDSHIYWWPPSQASHRGQTPMVNDPLHSIEVKLTRSTDGWQTLHRQRGQRALPQRL